MRWNPHGDRILRYVTTYDSIGANHRTRFNPGSHKHRHTPTDP
jgi:hypothetical protein